jgi:carboxypeptidase Q
MKKSMFAIIAAGSLSAVATLWSQTQTEPVDLSMMSAIRDTELARSQVMDHVSWLADVYGPRLTGSPGYRQASDWVLKKFGEWGLANPHKENFAFGKSWALERFSAHMIEPQISPLIGMPKSWTPGTNGKVAGEVVRVDINSEADFEKYRGKLAGKVVLTQPARDVKMLDGIIVSRWNETLFKEAETTPLTGTGRGGGGAAGGGGGRGGRGRGGRSLADRTQEFFMKEGVIAALDRGGDQFVAGDTQMKWQAEHVDGGTIFVQSGGPHDNETAGKNLVPQVTLAVEHYNRMLRILEKNIPVKVELDIQAHFIDETEANGYNVVAEIPGTDLASEIVLLGAHLDSHHGATGATDNAAGSSVMMEAMRLLKSVGAKPRRTIRIALWAGEEEGLLGSHAYVRQHLADDGKAKPEYSKFSAYYNLDNGTGRIRGVWLQGNLAVKPIFEAWLAPFRDLDVPGALATRSITGSDYTSFDAVGVPAFQFMQDRLEYNSRTHHSNMDTVDRVQRDDLVQASIVVAGFAYNTAMRAEKLPRKSPPYSSPVTQ